MTWFKVESQCTFWCSVLSDKKRRRRKRRVLLSQCTFWCSVLSDPTSPSTCSGPPVSKHLLVLSAFRLCNRTFHHRH